MESISHYHRVDTCLWLCVARSLQRLVLAIVERPDAPDASWLNRNHAEMFCQFLDEMEFGYVHPRRSSVRRRISPYRREASQNRPAYPSPIKT